VRRSISALVPELIGPNVDDGRGTRVGASRSGLPAGAAPDAPETIRFAVTLTVWVMLRSAMRAEREHAAHATP
jgi:hypothetical protein